MKLQFLRAPNPLNLPENQWLNPQWQAQNSLKTETDFTKYFDLSEDESAAFSQLKNGFRFQTTPFYASLADSKSPNDPIRKILMPSLEEQTSKHQQMLDPLGESRHSPVSRIIHRYPDRLLFLVTDSCQIYCRYCTRKHFTGKSQVFPKPNEYEQALEYIKKSPGVREVILSGGDPLSLSIGKLKQVISDLRKIDHVEVIRIGTRIPVVNPMKITDEWVQTFKKFHPIYIMVHFNHPREISLEAAEALTLLVDNGFPVMNQMVLLNGVNNHPAIVQALSRRLMYLRVKPYYMFQADPSEGTDYLRTSVENSKQIQQQLWGRLSGLAMPNLSLDIPDGGGKMGIVPDFVVSEQKNKMTLKGWDGHEHDYISPRESQMLIPSDVNDYMNEWKTLKDQTYGKQLQDFQPSVLDNELF